MLSIFIFHHACLLSVIQYKMLPNQNRSFPSLLTFHLIYLARGQSTKMRAPKCLFLGGRIFKLQWNAEI